MMTHLPVVSTIDNLFPGAESTLTKQTGLHFILRQLLEKQSTSFEILIPVPDRKSTSGHLWAYEKIERIMLSPILKKMLTSPTNFSFNQRSKIIVPINRAELGHFDASAIVHFLIAQFKGQIVVDDFGPYAREMHSDLLDQHRLIAGVNFLDELPPKLRQLALLAETLPCGTTFKDAETLADAARLARGTNEYTAFVDAAMNVPPPPPVAYRDPRTIRDRTRRYVPPKPSPRRPRRDERSPSKWAG